MADNDYKAFIVEGTVREPQVINNISGIFFSHGNCKIITLPAGENIYMLWKKLKADDFDTDIIEVLRESNVETEKQLDGLSRDDFSEVFLFFDYDAHQDNLGKEDDEDVIVQMLKSFDNETENGKLYISYPMVESLRDYEPGICGKPVNCFVKIEDIGEYKTSSAQRSVKPHFRDYTINDWKDIIDVFSMRISCLIGRSDVISYEQYLADACPYDIYDLEKNEAVNNAVFILSAFPEFLVDYFGKKLWITCIKHTRNQSADLKCNQKQLEQVH